MKGILDKTSGLKTFTIAILGMIWAMLGMFLADQPDAIVQFDTATGSKIIMDALLAISIRLGIMKLQ